MHNTLKDIYDMTKSESANNTVGYRFGYTKSPKQLDQLHIFPLIKCDNCGEWSVIDEGVHFAINPSDAKQITKDMHIDGAIQMIELNRGGWADNEAEYECDKCC